METVFTVEIRRSIPHCSSGTTVAGYYDTQAEAESSAAYRLDADAIVRRYRYDPATDSVLTACRCYATGSTVAFHAEKFATLD